MPRVAVVGVVGRTNAGKSTLVNALVGEKVSIVSPVEQTTRNTVRGIVADPRGQLVLLDTPGLHKAVGELGRLLNRMARRSAAGTDITCVVFDASDEPQLEDIGWMQRIAKEKPEKVVFVLNKADKSPFFETMFREAWAQAVADAKLVDASRSGDAKLETRAGEVRTGDAKLETRAGEARSGDAKLETRAETQDERPETSRLASPVSRPQEPPCLASPVSCPAPVWLKTIASTPGGATCVADALFDLADEGEPLFDADIVTDYPRKLAIADTIREKYLAKLHQELPHELGIVVKRIDESANRWDVKVDVLVNRASQKPMVIGRGAETVKYVRQCAERELKGVFGVKVALEIWVRVEPNWMKNERLLAEMGYLGELV